MENSKANGAGEKPSEPNPNPNPNPNPSTVNSDDSAAAAAAAEGGEPTRRPFTALSQVDADLALARVLQEQERAYMMIRMGGDGSEYSSEAGSYDEYEEEEEEEEFEGGEEGINHDHLINEGDDMDGSYYDEDAFDANNNQEVDIGEFEDDEAFARALQDAEEREVAVRLMQLAGLSEWRAVEPEDHGSHSQDAWQEVDPDEYSYEELIAIGEVVGTESRGASADTIASLPSVNYKSQNVVGDNAEQCVVCRVEFEEDESLSILPCKHMYHPECISKWLQINKACPMCSKEVSTSGDSKQD